MAKQVRKKRTKASPGKAKYLRKVATGIAGLDEVLNGGLPAGRTSLVSGGPGTGKSVLGLEFICRGMENGKPGIFVTFEERAESVRENALTIGCDLDRYEKEGKLHLIAVPVSPEAVISGDFNIKALLAIIEGKAKSIDAERIVIDAMDVILRLFDDPKRERNELYAFNDWLLDRRVTTLMTVKASLDMESTRRYEFLDFMADCVIHLDNRVVDQVTTRRMRVLKYRGSDFGSNEYPFAITGDGFEIIPMSTVGLQHQALGSPVSSGHVRLDAVLGGGYRRGSCILITGTSGTGKSTLACTFTRAACERGEKTLYINFEESQEAMVSTMLSPGIDLRPLLRNGSLEVLTSMPESMGVEQHLVRSLKSLRTFEPDHVVVDTISACQRMGSERVAFDYIVRLVNACKDRGSTIMLINQAAGFTEKQEISGIGISSIVDTTVALRFIDIGGEVNRMLLVMKSRGSTHSNQYREFLITDDGINVLDVYVGEGGVLTGVARQEQEAKEAAELLLKQQEIHQKEKELVQMKATMEAEAVSQQSQIVAAEAALEQLKQAHDLVLNHRNNRGALRREDVNSKRLDKPALRRGRKAGRRKGDTR